MPSYRRFLLRLSTLLFGLTALLAFIAPRNAPSDNAQQLYNRHLQQLHAALAAFEQQVAANPDAASWPVHFRACRREYKFLEALIEYQHPFVAQRLNGAAVPEVEAADPNEVAPPSGFQVLEERVFAAEAAALRPQVRRELRQMLRLVDLLRHQPAPPLPAATLYDALRLNLYRLAAKNLAGFDSPTARQSVPEAVVTLQATAELLQTAGPLTPELTAALGRCQTLLAADADFDGFDRARFLTRGFQPLLRALHQQQIRQGISFAKGRRTVRPEAVSFLAAGAFDAAFFAPADAAAPTPAVLTLGQALFSEAGLSPAGRSCASCHLPAKAYADGLKVNLSLQHQDSLRRNTPSLLGAALQPALFYDMRVRYLEEQIHDVVRNRAEMNGQLDEAAAQLHRQPRYARAFAAAFPQQPTPATADNLVKALAAYIRTLTGLNTRFDQYLRGDSTVLSTQEVRGFNLFVGKAQCGTCHYLPLFSGTVPPLYDKAEAEVLGVPTAPDQSRLDPDPGLYAVQRLPHRRHAFKTPTVRNAARTAPYMHNGAYQTLTEVIDFYDRGGGQGLGLSVPSQTLSPDPLHLSAAEKQALVAFIGALDEK